MNERERELTQRHLDELVRMRDLAWVGVLRGEGTLPMTKHEALVHAIKALEQELHADPVGLRAVMH